MRAAAPLIPLQAKDAADQQVSALDHQMMALKESKDDLQTLYTALLARSDRMQASR